ncbi:MAG: restriction endonuclease subunit S [Treponema sp.]|nr:restriction endonuclease subunit S [Treponema sp.]
MSKLDELIKELCPNGVEYKTLGEVATINRGVRVTRDMLQIDGKIPVYQNALTPLGYFDKSNRKSYTTFVISAGAAGQIGFSDVEFWAADDCFTFEDLQNCNSKYIYYFLKTKQTFIDSRVRRGSIPRISRDVFEKFEIPVPPLEVQDEIVRILDKFTSLEAELEAELEARRKQYEYYRDSLLTFGDDVEWKTLGEIATITRGGSFQKKDFVENGLPCIHYGQMYTHFRTYTNKTLTFLNKEVFDKSRIAQPNDIVMAVTSENVEDVCSCVAWLGNENIAVSGHTAIIHHNQNAKYLAYYFQTSAFFKQKQKLAHGTKVIEVTPDKLKDVVIPIPSIKEQQRIVSILDRFESLCNDITSGLPAEIEARKKQYEYYRDKLLSFKRKEAV